MKRFAFVLLMTFVCFVPQMVYAQAFNNGKNKEEVKQEHEYGEVTTIIGNGPQDQGDYSLDHPRHVHTDSKGNIYFIDGSQKTAKLRMWDGQKNQTIVDFKKDKVTKREGMFFSTGLAIINDVVYVSSEEDVYKIVGGRATQLDSEIRRYMDNKYEFIYRMEEYDDDLVLMLRNKSNEYAFVRYDLDSGDISELLPPRHYYSNPQNFYIDKDGILVACDSGNLYYVNFFPRRFKLVVDTNVGQIKDAWFDKDDLVHFVMIRDKVHSQVWMLPEDAEELGDQIEIAGSRRGFQDGIADQVEMDIPTDFFWDGSGYLFVDGGNNAIRKLWIDNPPSNTIVEEIEE